MNDISTPSLFEDTVKELPGAGVKTKGNGSPTFFVMANGCPENRIDTAYLNEFLTRSGFTPTTDLKAGDLIIFSACALTREIEERSLYLIESMKFYKKPSAKIIICGCLPKISGIRLSHVHGGSTFDSNDDRKYPAYFRSSVSPESIAANRLLPSVKIPLKGKYHAPPAVSGTFRMRVSEMLISPYRRFREQRINAFRKNGFLIKVATGCLCNCSFCAVRFSRGRLRSKPLDRVLGEFDEGRSGGYREFALIGTNPGFYGKDLGIDLCVLLEKILERRGDYQLRLRNIHPRALVTMWRRLGRIFESGKVVFMSTAVQSGSPSILKRMKRGYDIGEFEDVILSLKKDFPKIQLRTQVMVGFPGESRKDFYQTVRFLERVRFDFVEVYQYQPRPGTEAVKMKNRVPHKIARKRYHHILMKF